ncbi:MAG: SRPBCC domain-containing protein [Candidatus Acidiferrales bacterium]
MTERNDSVVPANTPTRRQIIFGAAAAFGGLAVGSANAWASSDGLSHSAESIHMEPVFKASPARVYDALTITAQFDKVAKLSAAMQSGMAPATKPTMISRVAGGAFSLFGGYVTGRNIELVPDKRIVQAWRPMTWAPGIYSIAKFELAVDDSGTKIVFDHTGFPQGTSEHLAEGWRDNYWNPLVLFLAAAP